MRQGRKETCDSGCIHCSMRGMGQNWLVRCAAGERAFEVGHVPVDREINYYLACLLCVEPQLKSVDKDFLSPGSV